jgi:hypothetical protein
MSSRGSRVDVMETSKDWPGDDRSGGAERTRSGRMQTQTSVEAIAVVVSRELPGQPDQMALVDHDDVVQAFPAESPHQSLSDRIGVSLQLLRLREGSLRCRWLIAPLQPAANLGPGAIKTRRGLQVQEGLDLPLVTRLPLQPPIPAEALQQEHSSGGTQKRDDGVK